MKSPLPFTAFKANPKEDLFIFAALPNTSLQSFSYPSFSLLSSFGSTFGMTDFDINLNDEIVSVYAQSTLTSSSALSGTKYQYEMHNARTGKFICEGNITKQSRNVTAVQFCNTSGNENNSPLIFAFDKLKGEPGIVLVDKSSASFEVSGSFAMGDGITSIAHWRQIILSANLAKTLKFYDIRSPPDPINGGISSKEKVLGVKSFADESDWFVVRTESNEFKVFDWRQLSEPVFTIGCDSNALNNSQWIILPNGIAWKELDFIQCVTWEGYNDHLNEIIESFPKNIPQIDIAKLNVISRAKIPLNGTEPVFGLIANDEKLITISPDNSIHVCNLFLQAPSLCLKSFKYFSNVPLNSDDSEDIAAGILKRASDGYLIDPSFNFSHFPSLGPVWSWVANCKSLGFENFPSIHSFASSSADAYDSRSLHVFSGTAFETVSYSSKFRKVLIRLCTYTSRTSEEILVEELLQGNFERVIELVSSDPQYCDIFQLFSCSTSERSNEELWAKFWQLIVKSLPDHLLRLKALLSFFADHSHKTLLKNADLPLYFRLDFAARYCSDASLLNFLQSSLRKTIKKGNLDGLLITGLNTDNGLKLLKAFVDRSGDVQTASLLALCGGLNDPMVATWTQAYRTLLNRGQLYHERIKFDKQCKSFKSPHVTLICYYCNSSIFLPFSTNFSLCPKCNKPLPKCPICRLSLNGEWINMCMSCGHAGHKNHYNDWFATQIKCPVATCQCYCRSSY